MAKRACRVGISALPASAPNLQPEGGGVAALVAELLSLDQKQLCLRWRNHLGGAAPAHLPRWLLARVLAFRLQAAAFGDHDAATLRKIRGSSIETAGASPPRFVCREAATREGAPLRPGTLIVREWKGELQRVTILNEGFAWNGETYGSLSKVAKAITGVSWNGHLFFGLKKAATLPPIGPPMRSDLKSAGGPKPARALRCAIYTRVSTDSGLEQDFNSLDNQREASEAYIRSQSHEGWKLLRERYDDGGFSGGTMERPALQRLLEDIRAKRIDIVVVYKVDRLTRSLADFAKLVELFDASGVSFISVTQSFNTTTSMGRLTLNMLLSFAQFEREITGERICDKVAASKKKGIWMGGPVPIGYRVENRALHIVEAEAEFVRMLFRRYLELGSVVRLKAALDAEGTVTPARIAGSGRTSGGTRFSRGHLYWLLSDPIYIGRLRHKGQEHDGLHVGVIEPETWRAVQEKLASQTQLRREGTKDELSFLAGKLFDDRGHRMGATFAAKGSRRWRYYVSRAALTGKNDEVGAVAWVSAPAIETVVIEAVGRHLSEGQGRNQARRIRSAVETAAVDAELTAKQSVSAETAVRLAEAIDMVTITRAQVEIVLSGFGDDEEATTTIIAPWTPSAFRRRRGIIPSTTPDGSPTRAMRARAREVFAAAIADARRWLDKLLADPATSIAALSDPERKSERSIRMTLSLAFLVSVREHLES